MNEKELAALQAEEKRLELEERKQALESKKLHDELARLELAEKRKEVESRKAQKERGQRDAGMAMQERRNVQAVCNHHTGGEGGIAVARGMGDVDRPTSMGAQQFLDGSFRVFCQRCFKEWHSSCPNGNEQYGPWSEGARLWQKSVNKQIMVVGGLKQTVTQVPSIASK